MQRAITGLLPGELKTLVTCPSIVVLLFSPFLARDCRDSMLSTLYAIANLSVRHTGGSVENGRS